MRLYLKMGVFWRFFKNPEVGKAIVFEAHGIVYASAIYRMSKSRYKVYVITQKQVFDMVFHGISDALDCLQGFYKGA